MIERGMWIQIQSFKHDGSLHRFWDQALVLDVTPEMYVVASKKTKVTEADGRRWYTREPAITFFSRKYWYNVIAMIKEDGVYFYCNIASPTVEEDMILKYIDYDLDLKLYPTDLIKILDEREYERHKEKYSYSEKLDFILKKEVNFIHRLMKKRIYPFKDELVSRYYEEFIKSFDEQYEYSPFIRKENE